MDGNGLWLFYKRLETGTFRMLAATTSNAGAIARAGLAIVLERIEL